MAGVADLMKLKHYHKLRFVLDNGKDSPDFEVDDAGLEVVRMLVAKNNDLKRQIENIEEQQRLWRIIGSEDERQNDRRTGG
jgi:hypothetical protein